MDERSIEAQSSGQTAQVLPLQLAQEAGEEAGAGPMGEALSEMLRNALKRHSEEHKLSVTEVAKRIAFSQPMVSNFLNGQLKPSKKFLLAVSAMLRKETGQSPILQEEGGEFVWTKAARKVIAACRLALKNRSLVVVVGPPGIGKTLSLQRFRNEASREHGQRLIFFTPSPSCTKRTLLIAVLKELGQPASGAADELAGAAVKALRHAQRMLVVDEANQLNTGALEMIRYLADNAGIPVVLAGTNVLLETFVRGDRRSQDLAQLYSRIAFKALIPLLDDDELRLFAKRGLGNVVDHKILERLRAHTHGSLRLLGHLLVHVRGLAQQHGRVTAALVDQAAQMIETGDGLVIQ